MSAATRTTRQKPDSVLTDIADYVTKYRITSREAYETARYCLLDTLGCGRILDHLHLSLCQILDPWCWLFADADERSYCLAVRSLVWHHAPPVLQ